MALVTHITDQRGSLVERLNATFSRLSEAHARRKIYRRTVNELAVLTDRELADLGIARGEIRAIARQAAYGE